MACKICVRVQSSESMDVYNWTCRKRPASEMVESVSVGRVETAEVIALATVSVAPRWIT